MSASRIAFAWLVWGALGFGLEAHAGAARTAHPVVFAHGMGGFDNILGFDYWGDDYGTFVGDPCNGFVELTCNRHLDDRQRAFVARVQAFESSEVRGLDLANDIESLMATMGTDAVNIIGHSQGGIDARKAARVLYERAGNTVIKVLVSVSSPHRGSPVARYILNQGPGVTSVAETLARYFGDTVSEPGNDATAGALQLVYGDYDPEDGKVTGMKAFNAAYPVDGRHAERYASVVTAQDGLNVNPALYLLGSVLFDIDGDGYCTNDCGPDGISGSGDGRNDETDDDGMVGINSQQMGYRLSYESRLLGFDRLYLDTELGPVHDLEAPTYEQAASSRSVLPQDHMDVIGVGPDTFDEMEFYATIIHSMARFDRGPRPIVRIFNVRLPSQEPPGPPRLGP
ncbi:esterase/lipase family protein [Hyalangium gracile]|uniref:esterase/lipase family protein n=1 Tax=Hyalangium gracile TaxID=394092 RepID=UPI001CCC11F0|nr:acetyltransferase [Hyalangium gracile]